MTEKIDNGNEEQYMQGMGVTTDKEAEVLEQNMLKNLANDVEAYERALQKHIEDKANYEEQLQIDLDSWEILLKPGALKKINPTYVFEEDPKWHELQEKKQAYKIREERAVGEGALRQYDMLIEETARSLASAKEKLAKFKGDTPKQVEE
jgi:hypothetical protein